MTVFFSKKMKPTYKLGLPLRKRIYSLRTKMLTLTDIAPDKRGTEDNSEIIFLISH